MCRRSIAGVNIDEICLKSMSGRFKSWGNFVSLCPGGNKNISWRKGQVYLKKFLFQNAGIIPRITVRQFVRFHLNTFINMKKPGVETGLSE
ncbi:MAG: hypothetical protein Kow0042_17400 [Calditrichia bacterium]